MAVSDRLSRVLNLILSGYRDLCPRTTHLHTSDAEVKNGGAPFSQVFILLWQTKQRDSFVLRLREPVSNRQCNLTQQIGVGHLMYYTR
jgi:hypothetical protein